MGSKKQGRKQASPLQALSRRLSKGQIRTDAKALEAASVDNLRISRKPQAVIFPEDEEDVSAVLKLANKYKMPVTVRGAGSSPTGSATPQEGGWSLDFTSWKRLHIDSAGGLAYAQPGVITADLQRAATKEGWYYPPDPSSSEYCTIGGNIACNAGGLHGAKYGVTRDYVMALEGILPTGEWVRWGSDLRKYAAGFNLRDLWVGSEGMLGVITGAVLRLIPPPESKATFLALFKNESDALRTVKEILGERHLPAILEFMDCQTVECTLKSGFKLPFKEAPKSAAALLIELDGSKGTLQKDAANLRKQLEKKAVQWKRARNKTEAEKLWSLRRSCSRAMYQLGSDKLNEDVVLPLDAMEEMMRFTQELKKSTGLATPTFGHAADGNLHVHIMYNWKDKAERKKAEKGVAAIMEKVVLLDGTISGEHGIGLAKSSFLKLQHGQAEMEAMKAIKKALDPNNILNPDKMFKPTRVWKYPKANVTFPWDHK